MPSTRRDPGSRPGPVHIQSNSRVRPKQIDTTQFFVRTVCLALSNVDSTVGDPVSLKNPRTAMSYSVLAVSPATTHDLATADDRHEDTTVLVSLAYAYTQ